MEFKMIKDIGNGSPIEVWDFIPNAKLLREINKSQTMELEVFWNITHAITSDFFSRSRMCIQTRSPHSNCISVSFPGNQKNYYNSVDPQTKRGLQPMTCNGMIPSGAMRKNYSFPTWQMETIIYNIIIYNIVHCLEIW